MGMVVVPPYCVGCGAMHAGWTLHENGEKTGPWCNECVRERGDERPS